MGDFSLEDDELRALVESVLMGIPNDFEKARGVRRAWRPVDMASREKVTLMALKVRRRDITNKK